MPSWVQHTPTEAGYFYAKGTAGVARSFSEQVASAEAAALKALAQSISVSVNSTQRNDMRVKRTDGKESVSRDVSDVTQVRTQLTLQKVEHVGQWLDAASCTLWVQLRVSQNSLRHQRLRDLLARAKESSLAIPDRHEALDVADALLPQIDFAQVADSEGANFFRVQVDKERKSLLAIDNTALAIVIVDRALPASISREALSTLPSGRQFMLLEQAGCDILETCVQVANRHGSRTLLFGRIHQSQSQSMLGGISGKLTLEFTLVDARTGTPLWGPIGNVEPLLTFEEFTETDWREAAKKGASAAVFRPLTLCLAPKAGEKVCS